MATLRDIKRRITSVASTMQITSAMKMVSAAKLARAQQAARAAQPFSEGLRQMVVSLAAGMSAEDNPLFARREEGKTLVVLFSTDRGLCGGFNSNLNRKVARFLASAEGVQDPELLVFGRVGNDYFKHREWTVSKAVVQASFVEKQAAIRETIEECVERFRTGEVAKVYLAYNHFHNPMRQEPSVVPLLPIEPPEDDAQGETDDREMLFEPSREAILDSLLPRYVEDTARLAHLNTEAGEHGARMVSMESATKNAGDMIDRLTLQYNRLRQAAITKELTEIINGAQSL